MVGRPCIHPESENDLILSCFMLGVIQPRKTTKEWIHRILAQCPSYSEKQLHRRLMYHREQPWFQENASILEDRFKSIHTTTSRQALQQILGLQDGTVPSTPGSQNQVYNKNTNQNSRPSLPESSDVIIAKILTSAAKRLPLSSTIPPCQDSTHQLHQPKPTANSKYQDADTESDIESNMEVDNHQMLDPQIIDSEYNKLDTEGREQRESETSNDDEELSMPWDYQYQGLQSPTLPLHRAEPLLEPLEKTRFGGSSHNVHHQSITKNSQQVQDIQSNKQQIENQESNRAPDNIRDSQQELKETVQQTLYTQGALTKIAKSFIIKNWDSTKVSSAISKIEDLQARFT